MACSSAMGRTSTTRFLSTSRRRLWAPRSKSQRWRVREELSIPAGTQPGDRFTLKNKGVPYLRQNQRGSQIVTAEIRVPTSLTDDQRKMFEALAESMGKNDVNGGKGIFEKIKDALGSE